MRGFRRPEHAPGIPGFFGAGPAALLRQTLRAAAASPSARRRSPAGGIVVPGAPPQAGTDPLRRRRPGPRSPAVRAAGGRKRKKVRVSSPLLRPGRRLRTFVPVQAGRPSRIIRSAPRAGAPAPPTASSSAAETETAADDFFSPPCSTDHPGGAAISFPPPSFRQGGAFSACYYCILLIFSHSHPAGPLLSARCCRLLKGSILPAYDIRFFLPLFAAQGRAASAASGYVSNKLLKMYRNSLIFTKNCHLSSNVRVKLYINAHRTFLNLSIVFLPRRGIKFHCNRQITIVHQEMSNKFLWVLLKSKKQISVIRYSHN